jgi:hypothetical protein
MKHIVSYRLFENNSSAESLGLYDEMSKLLTKANILVSNFNNENPDDYTIDSPDEAMELLSEISDSSELYNDAQDLFNEIDSLNNRIDELDSEDYFTK